MGIHTICDCDSDELVMAYGGPNETHEGHGGRGTRHNTRYCNCRACDWAWMFA
jgi:hypothetical protein